ncbi:GHKL domain-containing protein [Eubacterium sp. MSJ-13]|uniref:sensor histidine kinase n=1 Tax=Eubacterium sp. MSJ-13 TaxID=2841513 RepID=UPI001C0F78F5|nr:GHKL domain-containing protein [Eubacterium sp. MSJ-13]MBU5478031.1 GHKL domain-containing protein [Eubacterium sp. MSJ-13]
MTIGNWCDLLNLVSSLMEPFFSIIFVSAFMGERFDKRKKKIAALTVISQFIFVIFADRAAIFSVNKFFVAQTISLLGLCLIYKRKYDRILLAKIVDILSMLFLEDVVSYIVAFVFQKPLSIFLVETKYRLIGIVLVFLSKAILAFGIKICFKDVRALRRSSVVIITLLSSGIIMLALYMYSDSLKKDRISFLQMVMMAILIFMYILVIFSIFMFEDNRNKDEEMALVALHSKVLYNSLEQERTTFDMWRKRLHDYKNQLIYMRDLLEKEQYKQIAELVNKEIGELKKQSIYVESGYLGIDAIVNSKLMYAQGQGVHPIYNINIPQGLQIDDFVMASILGNLLDNAIRAAVQTEEKYFEVNISYIFESLNIKVLNSVACDKIDFEKSSKKESEVHGIGISSVKENVKKLRGSFSITQDKNIVKAVVEIPFS